MTISLVRSSPASAATGRPTAGGRFLLFHLWLPLLLALAASAVLMGVGVDRWLADWLFRAEGGHWALKDAWLTSTLIHRGGKTASTLAGLAVIALCAWSWRRPAWRTYRRPLLYLALAVAASTLLVSVLKSLIHMDCPWDLARYGGTREFIGLLQSRPASMPASQCFPAGHASAGYAWVALYFAALAACPRWRWIGLDIGLGAGMLFGISQQLRGAHFLSHDVWTLATCWLVALGLYLLMLRPRPATTVTPGETA